MSMKTLIVSLSIILTAPGLWAQQRPPTDTAGPPHAALRRFEGEWDAHGRMWVSADTSVPPREGVLVLRSEMVLGGRFLVETMTTQPPSPPFESVRIVGYDNLTRRYEGVTYDSRGTNILRQVGDMNAAGELVLTYSYVDQATGDTVTRRTVRRVVSENEWIESAYERHSGVERKVVEIRARRRR